jgi:hypothetical protein
MSSASYMENPMSDDPWTVASFDGNRRLQQREFMALSFREKLEVIERMAEVAARLAPPSPMTKDEALAMQGVGWEGDLEGLRSGDGGLDRGRRAPRTQSAPHDGS